MDTIQAIGEDILTALGTPKVVENFGLADDLDPKEALVLWLLDQRNLRETLLKEFGKITLREILGRVGIPFDRNATPENLVDEWLSNREMAALIPAVRPQEVASTIAELANQIRTTPDKFDSLEVLFSRCRLLLRYVLLFYAPELAKLAAARSDVAAFIELRTFEELCDLCACETLLRREPYKPLSPKSVRLADESLKKLLALLPSLVDAKDVSDRMLELVERWRPSAQDTVIPKGVVLETVSRGGYGIGGTGYDESGARLTIEGIYGEIRNADNVLLAVSEETEVRAPQLKPVPQRDAWHTPGRTSCGLPEGPKRAVLRRIHNQVFISYAREDQQWVDRVRSYLRPLEEQKTIKVWDDSRIEAGDRWREKIKGALTTCGIAVLVISESFFRSEFILSTELPILLKASRDENVRVIPLYVAPSPVDLYREVADLQGVGTPERSLDVISREEQQQILVELARTIESGLR